MKNAKMEKTAIQRGETLIDDNKINNIKKKMRIYHFWRVALEVLAALAQIATILGFILLAWG